MIFGPAERRSVVLRVAQREICALLGQKAHHAGLFANHRPVQRGQPAIAIEEAPEKLQASNAGGECEADAGAVPNEQLGRFELNVPTHGIITLYFFDKLLLYLTVLKEQGT